MHTRALLIALALVACKKETPAEPAAVAKPKTEAPKATGAAALFAADVWICDGGAGKSWINKGTTRAEIEALVGAENLKDEEENFMESEETFVVTTLFPDDKARRATIHWMNDDATQGVARLDLYGKKWRTSDGLYAGASLAEVEKINGGPFELMGFEWDMAGMATTESAGIDFVVPKANRTRPEYEKVVGDGEFKSTDPNMRAVEPIVGVVKCQPI